MSWVHTLIHQGTALVDITQEIIQVDNGTLFLCTFFSWTLQLPPKKNYLNMMKDDVLNHNCGICLSMFISCWHLERVMICSHSYGPKCQL